MNLVNIWNQTEYESNFYKDPPKSIKYSSPLQINFNNLPKYSCNIVVLKEDSIDVGYLLKRNNFNPVVLNMSCWVSAGGNVVAGARSQEEDLFRKSNYNKTLLQKFYPLKDIDTIYSNNVTVFKDSNYNRIIPFYLSFIAAPSINNPGESLNKNDSLLMTRKIKMLFDIALLNGHDSIVLSAWGCGAYRCPPIDIATLFKKEIDFYKQYFKNIFFAIKVNNNSETSNFNVFNKIIH